MSALTDFWGTFATAAIANNSLTRAQAVDLLQNEAAVTNVQGNTWFDAVAEFYESIGVINNATYSALRNEIINEGNGTSQTLFQALEDKIAALPESEVVIAEFGKKDTQDELDQLNADVLTVTTARDLLDPVADRALVVAYNAGLKQLQRKIQNATAKLLDGGE